MKVPLDVSPGISSISKTLVVIHYKEHLSLLLCSLNTFISSLTLGLNMWK